MGYTNKKLFCRVSAIYFYLEIKRESAYEFLDHKSLTDLFWFRISIISLPILDWICGEVRGKNLQEAKCMKG